MIFINKELEICESFKYGFFTIYPLPWWERNKEREIAFPLVGEGKGEGEFKMSSKLYHKVNNLINIEIEILKITKY